jgi:hypothetical protein
VYVCEILPLTRNHKLCAALESKKAWRKVRTDLPEVETARDMASEGHQMRDDKVHEEIDPVSI